MTAGFIVTANHARFLRTASMYSHFETPMRYAMTMRQMIIAILFFAGFAMAQETSSMPDLGRLKQMAARFAPTPLHVDRSGLSSGDQAALSKLIEAARLVNHL